MSVSVTRACVCVCVCVCVCACARAYVGAWLRGSLPNYRAEANYITSDVKGNYEKHLEDANTMKVSLRTSLLGNFSLYGILCEELARVPQSSRFKSYFTENLDDAILQTVSGKLPPRTVAYNIGESAYLDVTSPDCTGSVSAAGQHGATRLPL